MEKLPIEKHEIDFDQPRERLNTQKTPNLQVR